MKPEAWWRHAVAVSCFALAAPLPLVARYRHVVVARGLRLTLTVRTTRGVRFTMNPSAANLGMTMSRSRLKARASRTPAPAVVVREFDPREPRLYGWGRRGENTSLFFSPGTAMDRVAVTPAHQEVPDGGPPTTVSRTTVLKRKLSTDNTIIYGKQAARVAAAESAKVLPRPTGQGERFMVLSLHEGQRCSLTIASTAGDDNDRGRARSADARQSAIRGGAPPDVRRNWCMASPDVASGGFDIGRSRWWAPR